MTKNVEEKNVATSLKNVATFFMRCDGWKIKNTHLDRLW
jgi:hypothetical protein